MEAPLWPFARPRSTRRSLDPPRPSPTREFPSPTTHPRSLPHRALHCAPSPTASASRSRVLSRPLPSSVCNSLPRLPSIPSPRQTGTPPPAPPLLSGVARPRTRLHRCCPFRRAHTPAPEASRSYTRTVQGKRRRRSFPPPPSTDGLECRTAPSSDGPHPASRQPSALSLRTPCLFLREQPKKKRKTCSTSPHESTPCGRLPMSIILGRGRDLFFPKIQKQCSSSANAVARLFTTASRRSRLPPARLCIRLPRMRKTRQLPPHHPPSAAGQSGNARRAVSALLRGLDLSRRCSMDSPRSQ